MRGRVLATVWLCGCGGLDAVDAPDEPDGVQGTAFTCNPSQAPSPTPMRRLSHDQYARTVDAAIQLLGGPELDAAVGPAARLLVARVPQDFADVTLSREDQVVSQVHAEHWYLVAEAIADAVVDRDSLACHDTDCVESIVGTMGARLLRQPLSPEERAFYVDEVYGAAPNHMAGLRDLILVWLASPPFAMQIEHGQPGAEVATDTVPLTAHELANRLSFHAWNAPPDDTLWALAEDGSLLDDAVYAAEVERVFADPASQVAREQFFRDWLQLNALPALDAQVGLARFDAFRGAVTPGPDLHERVQRDALDLLQWHVDHGSDLDAVWTQPVHTVMDPEVAALYGVSEVWDGESAPADLATGHGGLLTRPAFHVTGTADTRPIHKGVLIRRRVLCDQLGDPPADIGGEPDIDPIATQRERTEQLTEVEGSSCAACHGFINGLGFVSEGYDSLGRPRGQEEVLDDDGTVLATWPIDDRAVAQVEIGDMTEVGGALALGDQLAATPKVDTCLARFWFRHTWGRAEDDAVDGCVLLDVEQRLTNGEDLASALRSSALDDGFRLRRLDEITEGGAR